MAKNGKIELDVKVVVVCCLIGSMFFYGRMFEDSRARSVKRQRVRSLAGAMVQDNLNKVAEMKGLYLRSKPQWTLEQVKALINQ